MGGEDLTIKSEDVEGELAILGGEDLDVGELVIWHRGLLEEV
jgi:hypothetical protein